jgi:hypothetical protein
MWFCRDLWTDAAKDGLKESGKGRHQKMAGGHKRDIPLREKRHDKDFVKRHKGSMDKRAEGDVKAAVEAGSGSDLKDSKDKAAAEKAGVKAEVKEQVVDIQAQAEKDVPAGAAAAAAGKKDDTPEGKRDEDEQSSSDQDAIDEDASNPAPEPLKPQDLPASAFLIPNSAFTAARILINPRCVTTYGGVSHSKLALDLFGGERDEPQHRGGNYVLEDWAGPPDSFVCQEMRTTGGRTAPKSQRRVGFLLQNEVGI